MELSENLLDKLAISCPEILSKLFPSLIEILSILQSTAQPINVPIPIWVLPLLMLSNSLFSLKVTLILT